MKLPDFTNDAGLLALRRRMGADAPGSFSPSYQPNELTLVELEQLSSDGKDVSIDDVVALENGTLSYKDSRVLVYIRDISALQHWAPKFHIADCKTLQQKQQQNGLCRYVVTTRDDGHFLINLVGKQVSSELMQLRVCQNCLDRLAFDGFSLALPPARRNTIVSGFTIPRFFEKFPKSLLSLRPTGAVETAPLNDYPADFDEISKRVRDRRSWRCECCRRDFSRATDREYLHVHHKNGMKNVNHEENLQVLCLGCHADEPQHAHLKNLAKYREFVRRFGPYQ
jgi:hypothetical protein